MASCTEPAWSVMENAAAMPASASGFVESDLACQDQHRYPARPRARGERTDDFAVQ